MNVSKAMDGRKPVDLQGREFDRWTVKKYIGTRKWLCVCKCGNEREVFSHSLVCGDSKSCGCLKKEQMANRNRTHGGSKSRSYIQWKAMRARCEKKSDINYHNYGERGIFVCDRWKDYSAFMDDFGSSWPGKGWTIDRIDNDKGYEPSNVRWATMSTQSRNTRRNQIVHVDGVSLTITDWSSKAGISRATIHKRLSMGWPPEKAVSEPTRPKMLPTIRRQDA